MVMTSVTVERSMDISGTKSAVSSVHQLQGNEPRKAQHVIYGCVPPAPRYSLVDYTS